jgi:hypothetical protein
MQKQKKEFSILKWIVFPANSVILAAIIAYFNVTVFGVRDGLPYSVIVGMIGLFSIVIVKYAESENKSLARAAFVFEIVLTAALIVNAVYSVSVQRKMSVAKMGETNQKETIGEISKLRGSRAQREALKKIDKQETAQTVFTGVENILFWIMAGELALYGLSAFTLFALAKLIDEARGPEPADEFPALLEVENRSQTSRPNLVSKTTTRDDAIGDTRFQQKTTQAGLKALRECLKLIAFENPPGHFKVDLRPDYLLIRAMESDHGDEHTTHSVRAKLSLLDDALRMAPEAFRERLEKFLRENDFYENHKSLSQRSESTSLEDRHHD